MINFLVWRALIQCLKQHLKMDWILFRILRTLKKTLPSTSESFDVSQQKRHTHHAYSSWIHFGHPKALQKGHLF
ncbi:hypothetical protein HHUSO_G33646 [Huso huso]|uniref:Uncharacterized protein n=1 Tax=Huso huso TaxID=61971 RepID=A0ABR0Y7W7_HUSHU